MIEVLLEVPHDLDSWNRFSFHNRFEIDRINAAILEQKQVNLPSYPLDPINFNAITDWLAYNSQAHAAFNAVLNLQSSDLLAVDLRDLHQRVSWIWASYLEIQSAEDALDI